MSRSQNVFFCGGNNPLKYIPMWFPIGFSLTLIYQDVLIPCGTLKETFAQKPSLSPYQVLLGFCSSHICCNIYPLQRVFTDIYLFTCLFTICKPIFHVLSARSDENG